MTPFLTARWADLAMANYAVPPEILTPRLPLGTELDFEDGPDGRVAYISLVAFRFLDTVVRGLRIPGHTDFVEINLRFYVRRLVDGEWRRGAVFVKEIVPRFAISLVANLLYGEPYETWRTSVEATPHGRDYHWSRPGRDYRFGVAFSPDAPLALPTPHESFILDHYWGYTRRGPDRTDEYHVEHPSWKVRSLLGHTIAADFGDLYGPEFAFLNGVAPRSVLVAEGSAVTVYKGARLGA